MIVSLRGECLAVTAESAVVEVGGVGLLITCTPTALTGVKPGQPCRLSTALIIREDAWSLYGFANDDERTVFEQLQTVAGVGPRTALGAIGALGVGDIVRAIGAGDVPTLVKIPGVGRKTAERLVLELRDKVGVLSVSDAGGSGGAASSPTAAGGWERQVREALVGLGWQQRDADAAIVVVAGRVRDEGLDTGNIPGLLKLALSALDRA